MKLLRIPITTPDQLYMLDKGEIVDGYMDGLKDEPEPGNNRSVSYWHGWRNGMVDGGHREKDKYQVLLAKNLRKAGWSGFMQSISL